MFINFPVLFLMFDHLHIFLFLYNLHCLSQIVIFIHLANLDTHVGDFNADLSKISSFGSILCDFLYILTTILCSSV